MRRCVPRSAARLGSSDSIEGDRGTAATSRELLRPDAVVSFATEASFRPCLTATLMLLLAFARLSQQSVVTFGRLVPSHHNFVCFNCRVAVRRPKTIASAPPCALCGGKCRDIGYKIPVPPKEAVDAWVRLAASLQDSEDRRIVAQKQARVARMHELERRIERLSRLPTSDGRERTIRDLRKRLDELHRSV